MLAPLGRMQYAPTNQYTLTGLGFELPPVVALVGKI